MMLAFIPYKMFVRELDFTIEVVFDMQIVHWLTCRSYTCYFLD